MSRNMQLKPAILSLAPHPLSLPYPGVRPAPVCLHTQTAVQGEACDTWDYSTIKTHVYSLNYSSY